MFSRAVRVKIDNNHFCAALFCLIKPEPENHIILAYLEMKNKKNGPIEKKRVEVQQFHISCSAPVPYEGSGEKVPHLVAAYFMKKMRANEGYSISIHKIQEKNEIPLSKKKICVHVELE